MRISNSPAICFLGAAVFALGCRPELTSDAAYLTVSGDLPPGLDVEFRREFQSVPDGFFCKTYTANTGDFIPCRKTVVTQLRDRGVSFSEPSVLDEWSWCTWQYLGASARLVVGQDNLSALTVEFTGDRSERIRLRDIDSPAGCTNTVRAACLKCIGGNMEGPGLECRYALEVSNADCDRERKNVRHLKFDVSLLQAETMDYDECRNRLSKPSNLAGNTFVTALETDPAQTEGDEMANYTEEAVSGMDLDAGYKVTLKAGDRLRLKILDDRPDTVRLRLSVDSDNPASNKEQFRLFSKSGGYSKILAVKDDMVPNDGYLDLSFEGVDKTQIYSMEVDPGGGGAKYFIFENKKFE